MGQRRGGLRSSDRANGTGGAISLFNGANSTDVLVDVEGYTAASQSSTAGLYEPLVPYRVCDTNRGNPSSLSGTDAQCNGSNNGGDTLAPGATLTVQVGGTNPSGQGAAGVPAAVAAVILNVGVSDTTAARALTVWMQSLIQPAAWNVSWVAGESLFQRVIVPVEQQWSGEH